jgi:hypothetical protein
MSLYKIYYFIIKFIIKIKNKQSNYLLLKKKKQRKNIIILLENIKM